MISANKVLFLSFAIVLGSHTLVSRGLAYDGIHNLFSMAMENKFFHYSSEPARIIFDYFYQLPVWLFIKLSSSSSLSLLTILHSFGLIWIHIISIVGCFLILPKDKKNFLFFPLFGFLTGPLPALGASVSVAISVCSYIYLTAFVIYYSNLSSWRHRLFFVLVPFPLLLSHELMSYMAFPLIFLCVRKYKSESCFLNKIIVASVGILMIVSSFLSFKFLLFHKGTINNSDDFIESLVKLRFIYDSSRGFNLPVIISLCLIFFLSLYAFHFKEKKSILKRKRGNLRNPLVVFLFQFLMSIQTKGKEKAPLFFY